MAEYVRYEPNHKEFGELMLSPQIQELSLKAAGDVVETARGLAPRPVEEDTDGYHYIDHFGTKPKVVTINGAPRAAAEAYNDAEYAARVEFGGGVGRPQGGSHGPPQRVLGRAGAIVGDYRGGPPA